MSRDILVRFVVDPDALNENTVGLHRDFLKRWTRQGILLSSDPCELKGLVLALAGQDSDARSQAVGGLWGKALVSARSRPLAGWTGMANVQAAEQLRPIAGPAQLACLGRTRACAFGADEDPVVGPEIELASLEHAHRSAVWEAAEHLERTSILRNERRDDVWVQRFETLASCSRQIDIVDSYCGSDTRGLSWFLHRLAISATNRAASQPSMTVTIYSCFERDRGPPDHSAGGAAKRPTVSGVTIGTPRAVGRSRPQTKAPLSADERVRLADGVLQKLRGSVDCTALPFKLMACLADAAVIRASVVHDRWVGFDNSVFDIGPGLTAFARDRARFRTTCRLTEKRPFGLAHLPCEYERDIALFMNVGGPPVAVRPPSAAAPEIP